MPSTSFYSSDHKLASRTTSATADGVSLRVECTTGLTAEMRNQWLRLRSGNPELANGCFHPEFARAVARVRDGVEYALLREDGELRGILPYQRINSRLIQPVGGMMNDFHGLVCAPATKVHFGNVLRQIGARRFDFHALAGNPTTRSSSHLKKNFRVLDCPFIDLSEGPAAYQQWLRQHSSTVRRQPQKTRAMIRDHGPMRLEFDCRDSAVLDKVIAWKRAKFQRTRTFDLLSLNWTSNLLRELFSIRQPDFRGVLSVLWCGDQPVSGHFGFLSEQRLHYYIPAHDVRFGRYSPGTELMCQLTQSSADNQVTRIDLGYGESELKDRFANGKTSVECGCIGFSSMMRAYSHGRYEVRQALKRLPLKESLKKIVRPLHPNLGKGKFR